MANRMKELLLTGRLWFLLGVRASGLALQFLLQVVLGQFVGAAGVGIFNVFTAWTVSLGEVAAQGQPTSLLRKISVSGPGDYAKREFGRSLFLVGRIAAIAFLALIALAILPAFQHINVDLGSGLGPVFPVLLITGCLAFACIRIASDTMKALDKNGISIAMENSAYPMMIILCGAVLIAVGGGVNVADLLVVSSVAIFSTACIFMLLAFQQLNRYSSSRRSDSSIQTKISTRETAAFCGGSVLNIALLSSPLLLMPLYADMADIGYFSVALKLINLIGVVLILLASIYGPKFARQFHSGDFSVLYKSLQETQILSLALFIPPVLALWLFSDLILGLFGSDFVKATPYLWVLVFGQFVNAATGLPGILLNMSGAAILDLQISGTALMLVALLTFVLGPSFGAMGVTIAFSSGLIFKNCLTFIYARKHCLANSKEMAEGFNKPRATNERWELLKATLYTKP